MFYNVGVYTVYGLVTSWETASGRSTGECFALRKCYGVMIFGSFKHPKAWCLYCCWFDDFEHVVYSYFVIGRWLIAYYSYAAPLATQSHTIIGIYCDYFLNHSGTQNIPIKIKLNAIVSAWTSQLLHPPQLHYKASSIVIVSPKLCYVVSETCPREDTTLSPVVLLLHRWEP